MKYKISFLLTLLLLLASCQQELALGEDGGTTTGKGHISFRVASMASSGAISLDDVEFKSVSSKAAAALLDAQESAVKRMDVVIFDASTKKYLATHTVTPVDIANFSPPLPVTSKTCNIYFIANLQDAITGLVLNSTSEDDFKKSNFGLTTRSQAELVTRGIPMSGTLLNCAIPGDGVIKNAPVTLTRLLARVDVVYTNSVPTQFTATSLQVCNVPATTPYYSPETVDPATYYNGMLVSNLTAEANPVSGTTYTYYIPANRRGSDSNTDPRLKLGTNASIKDPTYVKILGNYEYTLYLGGNDYNDYNILANTKYTVNASIKGTSKADMRVDIGPSPESNCYIVAPGGTIKIPVSRAEKGYTGAGGSFTAGSTITTGVLWCDVPVTPNVTPSVMLGNKIIKVVAGSTEGNSVIFAMSGSTIVWSWHIWVTNYAPVVPQNTGTNTATYLNDGILWMDRNIGATTATAGAVTTKGLYYQWGRKDPFPGSVEIAGRTPRTDLSSSVNVKSVTNTAVVVSNNLLNSIQNPITFYAGVNTLYDWFTNGAVADQKNDLWKDATSEKTIYDPCPVGWHVPFFIGTYSPWNDFTTPTSPLSNNGTTWGGSFYPASGYCSASSGAFFYVGGDGYYWSGSVKGVSGYDMSFEGGIVNPSNNFNRAAGFALRCVQQ